MKKNTKKEGAARLGGMATRWRIGLRVLARYLGPFFLLSVCLAGCGQRAGTMLYWMGAGQVHKIEAEFVLSEGPILILVDDFEENLTWAPAREQIAEALAKELIKHEATQKVISPETVKRYRRTHTDFDDLKCTQVGRLVGADQVIWLEVKAFYAEEEMHDTTEAASLAVAVRVINPNERASRSKVRLWPSNREGKPAAVQLNSNEVNRLKTKERIAAELTGRLATMVAKFFYKHPMEDPAE